MPSVSNKAFYFHAHASSLGGALETPHKKVVPSQASARCLRSAVMQPRGQKLLIVTR